MEKYGFVYIWYDRKHKRYYIGSHWGTEDDGYICSSNWMRNSYRRRPQDFKRRIISKKINDRRSTFLEENRFLQMIKVDELGTKYYNRMNFVCHFSGTNGNLSEKTKRKIASASKKQFSCNIKRKRHLDACYAKNANHTNKIWINDGSINKRVTEDIYNTRYAHWNKGRIFHEKTPFYEFGNRNRDPKTGRFCK